MDTITPTREIKQAAQAERAPSTQIQPSYLSSFSAFFGYKVAQTDPHAGEAFRNNAAAAAKEKFPITSSFFSGTKIKIPKSHYLQKGQLTSKQSLIFQGTQEEARQLIDQLKKLQGRGCLILRRRNDGLEFQHKRFWLIPKQENFSTYITSLFKEAKASKDTRSALKAYLSTKKQDNNGLQGVLEKLSFSATKPQLQQAATTSSVPSIEKIQPNLTIHSYLQQKYATSISHLAIGQGSFGHVYTAPIVGNPSVLKILKNAKSLDPEANPELNGKWWRQGDIAASRCKDLPCFAKSTAFILQVTSPPHKKKERYYVPTSEIKTFAQKFPSGTSIAILGQLMEKAPGRELKTLVSKNGFGLEHFNTIASQLFYFLEKTYDRNLIHRDLKLENLMFDANPKSSTYGQLTVIDFGLGGVYGKRSKMQPGITVTKSQNPLYSIQASGTKTTMAPAVLQAALEGTPYGSEVYFHRGGSLLIKILNPDKFNSVTSSLLNQQGQFLRLPPTSTQEYIELLGNQSQLAQTFSQHPKISRTIDLFFAVASATPDKRDAAFLELKKQIEGSSTIAIEKGAP